MNSISKRHHFIPKFLIKGFTNSENLLFIYDKVNDKLYNKARSPKSIFFENHRNTAETFDGKESSAIEDYFFQNLDNDSAKIIQTLQNNEIKNISLDEHIIGALQFFLINLFWRIPVTDYAFNDLMMRSKITSDQIDPEKLRNNETYRKLERIKIFKHTFEEISNSKPPKSSFFMKLSELENDCFLLGDFPILYKSIPRRFSDLGYMEYLFAISSTRIISCTLKPFGRVTKQVAYAYNSFIIDQSLKYVCASNYEILSENVEFYKRAKKKKILVPVNKFVFNMT